jgi:hypothetical protein
LIRETKRHIKKVNVRTLVFCLYNSLLPSLDRTNFIELPIRYTKIRMKPEIKPPWRLTHKRIRGGKK